MDKKDQMIMVVKKEILLGANYFQGFKLSNEFDYESIILNNFEYVRRGDAEEDQTHKQPIGYSLIINPSLKQVFVYQRSSKHDEKKLQGKCSWGIGGHIEKVDIQAENPISESMKRELSEEVKGLEKNPEIEVLGYINDDKDTVGKVHFGILYVVKTNSTILKPLDPEGETGELKPINELEKICSSSKLIVEGWSKIALNPLKKYLDNL